MNWKFKRWVFDIGCVAQYYKNTREQLQLLVAVQKDYKQRKLLTERGRKLYKLRGQTVEPVFGQIKDARRIDKFMQRGFEACRSEWSLICATHNLLKLWRSGKACWN